MDSRPNDRLAAWAPWTAPEPEPVTRPAYAPQGGVVPAPTPTADPHIASIFRTLRAVVGGNEMAVARRLRTDPSVIMDLEAGVTDFLPPWAETERIVQHYGALAGVDVSAVLDAMAQLIAATERERRSPPPLFAAELVEPNVFAVPSRTIAPTRPAAIAPRPARPAPTPRAVPPPTRAEPPVPPAFPSRLPRPALSAAFARSTARTTLVRASIGTATLVALYLAIAWAPQPLYASARALPAPLDRPLRGLADTIVWMTAPTRDGLRWIEMSDPRARKTDRLDITAKR